MARRGWKAFRRLESGILETICRQPGRIVATGTPEQVARTNTETARFLKNALKPPTKAKEKQDANDDFKNAYTWYGKVLKCNPANQEAKKGQDDTRFEFSDL